MTTDRVAALEAELDGLLAGLVPAGASLAPDAPLRPGSSLTAAQAVDLFADQVRSRALDVLGRRLKARGRGYYTIPGAGHEMNAVVGAVTRPDDPAFLHYRSGAFLLARARQVAGVDAVTDVARSFAAAADEPASGGRHKVIGSRPLWIPPQTSTIASHLPKAVGTAVLLDRTRRVPADAVVVCSFGDASVNHASALTAINAARYARRRGMPVPLVLVCEDNGLGISVPTPSRWIEHGFGGLPHLRYVRAEGQLDEVHRAVVDAVADARGSRRPVFVHLPTVRLWGHAGSDVEAAYRSREEIRADERRDPLLAVARRLVERGAATPARLQELVADARAEVAAAGERAATSAPLSSRREVLRPLAVVDPDAARSSVSPPATAPRRRAHFAGRTPEEAEAAGARTMAAHLNAALHDELLADGDVLVFGQDVGPKGGVYGLTARLHERFGTARVFDTLLDETTILGLAQGAGLLGLLPVPEIQYLAYLHNAIDQLRGEAASTSFFSDGAYATPMVVRVASFAYQKGFGGHFHNDNAVAALLEIPGLVVAAPARGDDAARLLRGCLALARGTGRVVCLLEPIALYHERDLHVDGDGGWCTDYPPPGDALLPGEVGVHGAEDAEVVALTYANGVRMTLRAAREAGVAVRVVDLRWLAPLPWPAIEEAVAGARHVVVVDECRASGGIADRLAAGLHRRLPGVAVSALTSADSYVPLGPAAEHVLLTETQIAAELRRVAPEPA
jgi:2-oxoisovalerate dehydrogenase E1 component